MKKYSEVNSAVEDALGWLTRYEVTSRNYDSMYIDRGNEYIIETEIRCINYDLQYRFHTRIDTRDQNRFQVNHILRETEHACEHLKEVIIEKMYNELMSGDIRNPYILFLFNRLNLRPDMFIESFKRIELMLKDMESTREVLLANNVYNRYLHSGMGYPKGVLDIDHMIYYPMRNVRPNRIYLSTGGTKKLFSEMLEDFYWIMNHKDGRGRSPVFIDSLFDVLRLNREVMEQIELYNAY